MSAQTIGKIKSKKTGQYYEVKWNEYGKEVYITYAGGSRVGTASSAHEAMTKAEAWLYDK